MVPRSSLKGGKNSLTVEKNKDTNTTQTKQPKAHRPSLHHHAVFPLCWVKRVKRKLVTSNGPEFHERKAYRRRSVQQSLKKRLQKDFTSRLQVTSGHTTVRQNHGHDAGQKYRNACQNGVA